MILTDYYRFARIEQKSKLRIDCTASTNSYNPLEALRNKKGALFLYLGDNVYTKAGKERKADLALSKTEHISSIYAPNIEKQLWYGDYKHTEDALLFVCKNLSYIDGKLNNGAIIEIFVARGQRMNRASLFTLLEDGELNQEIENLRNNAKEVETL